jgi:hypothetical protein
MHTGYVPLLGTPPAKSALIWFEPCFLPSHRDLFHSQAHSKSPVSTRPCSRYHFPHLHTFYLFFTLISLSIAFFSHVIPCQSQYSLLWWRGGGRGWMGTYLPVPMPGYCWTWTHLYNTYLMMWWYLYFTQVKWIYTVCSLCLYIVRIIILTLHTLLFIG